MAQRGDGSDCRTVRNISDIINNMDITPNRPHLFRSAIHIFFLFTFSPAIRHNASISMALLSRSPRSITRLISIAISVGLPRILFLQLPSPHLPNSNAGSAIGENSVLKIKNPSVGLSGKGATTSHDTIAITLEIESAELYVHSTLFHQVGRPNAQGLFQS
jgi:hypothetical protein